MEKLIKKITKLLSKAGVDEDVINNIVAELEKGDEENAVEEETPELPPVEETPVDDPKEEDGKALEDELPPSVEVEPQEENATLPNDEQVADAGIVDEVNPAELQPEIEPEIPQVPQEVVDLQNKVEEQKKTIDALLTRLDAMEDGLKKAGVIEGNVGSEVGVDIPRVPANDPQEDTMESVLAEINGRRKF